MGVGAPRGGLCGEPVGPGRARSPLAKGPIGCAPGEQGNKEQLPLTVGINPTIRKIASIAKKRWWKSPFIFHFSCALATLMHESLSVCRLNLYPVIFHVSGALVSTGFLVTESHCLPCGGESGPPRGWPLGGGVSFLLESPHNPPSAPALPSFGHKVRLAFGNSFSSGAALLWRSHWIWVVCLGFAVSMVQGLC